MEAKKEMKTEGKEILLWAAAAVLGAAVCLFAVFSAPDLAPVKVVLSSGISSHSSSSPSPVSSAVAVNSAPDTIRLNSATMEELMTLDGIGEVLASRIIAYRDTHGGVRSREEPMEVEGIGQKRLDAIRGRLTLE